MLQKVRLLKELFELKSVHSSVEINYFCENLFKTQSMKFSPETLLTEAHILP